jgi:transcription-repair coupling factor (superfamily II helicase)
MKDYDMSHLVQFLIYGGYVKTHTVEKPGEFSVRGHIIDVFTLNHDQPYRLDFFDQTLEQIKIFDVETQRSSANIEQVEIAPMHELFFTDHMKYDAISKIEKFFANKNLSQRELEKLNQDLESLSLRQRIDGLSIYIPFFNQEETTLLDFASNYNIYMIDVHKMKINEESTASDLDTYATTMNGRAFLDIPFRIPLSKILQYKHFEIDNYGLNSNMDAYDLNVSPTNIYQGNLNMLILDLKDTMSHYQIILSTPTQIFYQELITHLKDKHIPFEETQLPNHGLIHYKRRSSRLIY